MILLSLEHVFQVMYCQFGLEINAVQRIAQIYLEISLPTLIMRPITAEKNNNLDCTPSNNYEFNVTNNASENLHIGPTPSATKGNMFFYNQYDNSSYTYLFWMFGKGATAFSPSPNHVHLDVFTASNTSSDLKNSLR